MALRAVTAVEGLTAATAPEMSGLWMRLDLRRALRGLARDRSPVAVGLTGWSGGLAGTETASAPGPMGSTAEVIGTIDRVGADFIEIAVHAGLGTAARRHRPVGGAHPVGCSSAGQGGCPLG